MHKYVRKIVHPQQGQPGRPCDVKTITVVNIMIFCLLTVPIINDNLMCIKASVQDIILYVLLHWECFKTDRSSWVLE